MFDWWINGFLDFSIWQKIIATLVITQVTIASVTLYLHRHSAHNALELHPAVKHFFRFWIWLTSAQNTKEWTAIHRKHHAKCETNDDPHSPLTKGLKTVLLTGAELYQNEAANPETLKHYGQRTPDDWLEKHVYTPHKMKGVAIMAALDLFLFGLAGITIWAIQMIWIPVFAAGVINGLGHAMGYRNFECKDASRNISPWGLFIGGEELHNNHHTYPNSAKLSVKTWEFDIGWFYIRILSTLGLAKARHTPPKPIQDSHKLELDKDTVMAIIHNRFYILSQYHKNVMIPVIREQKAKMQEQEKRLFKRAKKLLLREENLVKNNEKSRINEMLDHDVMIKTIYEMSQALQDIWKKHPGSRFQEKLNELSEWCKQAEKSGIESLEEFAKSLRHYSLSSARA